MARRLAVRDHDAVTFTLDDSRAFRNLTVNPHEQDVSLAKHHASNLTRLQAVERSETRDVPLRLIGRGRVHFVPRGPQYASMTLVLLQR